MSGTDSFSRNRDCVAWKGAKIAHQHLILGDIALKQGVSVEGARLSTNVRILSNYYDQPVAQQQALMDRLIANIWRNKVSPSPL